MYFFGFSSERDQAGSGKSERNHQGLFSPLDATNIGATLSGLVDFGISFLMFVAIMIYYRIHPTWLILLFPVFFVARSADGPGVGLWLSALNAIYRDVRYVVPFLVQFWMFTFAGRISQLSSVGEVA